MKKLRKATIRFVKSVRLLVRPHGTLLPLDGFSVTPHLFSVFQFALTCSYLLWSLCGVPLSLVYQRNSV
jgi:hypothetical protein